MNRTRTGRRTATGTSRAAVDSVLRSEAARILGRAAMNRLTPDQRRELARRGGEARRDALTPERRVEIASLGGRAFANTFASATAHRPRRREKR
ncbi:MAG: hypothetical protein A2Y38_22725 [Spirochaetes bacterium GWB1_59_5]|nr:MAG: hypothetical protein A2Y38_22725 [Spirochaetes bacterium GWB1_59_5]